MAKSTIRLTAPKNYKISKITQLGNIPKGKTTFKIYIKKGRLTFPFPKTQIVNGTGYKKVSGGNYFGMDYVMYSRKK